MLKQCEIFVRKMKENGNTKTVRMYSYIAVLCEKGGNNVKAVRCDYFERREDVIALCDREFPGWNIKMINRLYEEDFKA